MNAILQAENITKVYPSGVVANKNISFTLEEGEIHAICGENGAGKSTLMKILFGIESPSRGRILFKGTPVNITSSQKAIELGIGMVHQHFMLVPSFTVAENLVLGIEPSSYTKIDRKKAIQKTVEISTRFNLPVTPEAKVKDITVGMMQKIEILKALYRGAKVLILDEPTAVLTPQETDELFEELILLKKKGHTIVFISHKLKEVKTISDRVTIIRKGEVTGSFLTKDITEEKISELMIGKLLASSTKKEKPQLGNTVLKVSNLNLAPVGMKKVLDNVTFSLREGEILGLAGIEGNGQTELIQLLTGRKNYTSGSITINKQIVQGQGINKIRSLGVSYIPEDRMKDGCAVEGTIWENLITNKIDHRNFSKRGILKRTAISKYTDEKIREYDVLCTDKNSQVGQLSGGNIQKIVVARECSNSPTILIADQPTRGVDVGAAQGIHEKITTMSENGSAILLISADLGEILKICTSLIVMFEGKITAYFDNISQLDEKELGLYMLGIKEKEANR